LIVWYQRNTSKGKLLVSSGNTDQWLKYWPFWATVAIATMKKAWSQIRNQIGAWQVSAEQDSSIVGMGDFRLPDFKFSGNHGDCLTSWPWPFDSWPCPNWAILDLIYIGLSVSRMDGLLPHRPLRVITAWFDVIPYNSFCKLVWTLWIWIFQHESDPVCYCSIKVMISEPSGLNVLRWFKKFLFQFSQHCLFCFVCIYLTFIISL